MMTPQDLAEMAPIPLTRPGESVVRVRMQTEHLHAVETGLIELGVSEGLIRELFEGPAPDAPRSI